MKAGLLIGIGLIAGATVLGCKRESGTKPGQLESGTSASAGDSGSATGSGSVSAVGNELTYQNVHVKVPWDVSDPVATVKAATEAAAGKGLKLSDGKTALEISSDGKTLRLDGRDCGPLGPGDRVVLTRDGKLTVNGADRTPKPWPTGALG
jgi:hypothetical protein